MKLLVVGPQSLTDVRVIRAAVRTAGWEDGIKQVIIPHNVPFSSVTERWAHEQWISCVHIPLEVWRYGNQSRAAIERDESAGKQASHLLVIVDYCQRNLAYWTALASRKKLKMFIYYAVVL